MRRLLAAVLLLLVACARQDAPEENFARWLSLSPERAAAFSRFEALLTREGVADVVSVRELWLTDQLAPRCVEEPFTMPPEHLWPNIIPTLRFIRDHVEPAIGELLVASAYRDATFNACVRGASQSAHLAFYALDLVPRNPFVGRGQLIGALCSVHAREGPGAGIGLGVYRARRFHIDARSYRGWGDDHRSGSFPCAAERV